MGGMGGGMGVGDSAFVLSRWWFARSDVQSASEQVGKGETPIVACLRNERLPWQDGTL